MSSESLPQPQPRWRVLVDHDRPAWKRLNSQMLAQVDVYAPDGALYLVKIVRNGPLVGASDVVTGGTPSAATVAQFVRRNLAQHGETGWVIKIDSAPTPFRGPRTRYVQPVAASAIVVDIATVLVEAIQRGDQFWTE